MKHVIAIDIGGTKTIGALFDEEATLLRQKKVPTNKDLGKDNLLSTLFEIVDTLKQDVSIECIAVGSAGRVNVDEGSVYYASDNLPDWTGVQLKQILEERYQIKTVVENDCKVTGLGEEWQGAAKGINSYVCLALGTGLGAAVKTEGVLLHGAHWSAGELGHMIIHPDGRPCNCGLEGCFEQYCSGTAIVRRYNDLSSQKILTGYDFFEKVAINETVALQVLDEFVEDLSRAIISLSNIYDPEMFIIAGGLVDTRQYWWNELLDRIERSPQSKIFKPRVEYAQLGSIAALYGAAYLGFNSL